MLSLSVSVGYAYNPAIRHVRTADPSAHVWADGKAWMYTSHDQDNATSYASMDGYRAFSSTDLINWTDHGEILHSRDVPWGVPGYMWAPTAAYRNGKYYLIFPHSLDGNANNMRCGVAVSNVPQGPFTYLGWIPDVARKWIDPCCFQDTDGNYYLYWGTGGRAFVAKLKSNMVELAEAPRGIDYGSDNFFEGSYMHKYNGKYYFSYNAQAGGAGYSIGTSPYGPFTYQGDLWDQDGQDHHSIMQYNGKWYFFYHWQGWNGGSHFKRNVAIEPLRYNSNGTIQVIPHTAAGVGGVPIGQTIWLNSADNGKFVSADLNLGASIPLVANKATARAWEKFQVVNAGNGTIALKAVAHNKIVSADLNASPDRPLLANRATALAWEKFVWIDNADGTISLKCDANGKYVSAEKTTTDRPLQADRAAIGAWEKFDWGY